MDWLKILYLGKEKALYDLGENIFQKKNLKSLGDDMICYLKISLVLWILIIGIINIFDVIRGKFYSITSRCRSSMVIRN